MAVGVGLGVDVGVGCNVGVGIADGTGVGWAIVGAGNVASGVAVGAAVGVRIEPCVGSRTTSGTLVKVGLGDSVLAGVIVGVDLDWEQPAFASVSNNRKPEMDSNFMYAAFFESTFLRHMGYREPTQVRLGNILNTAWMQGSLLSFIEVI